MFSEQRYHPVFLMNREEFRVLVIAEPVVTLQINGIIGMARSPTSYEDLMKVMGRKYKRKMH
jgi:hypothetical protein